MALSTLVYAAAPAAMSVADAAMAEDKDTVLSLLKQGGDVNAAQGDGMTALHWAAMHGDAALASTLLHAGGNVQATTRLGGYTPLHLAIQSGTRAVIDALVGRGADVNVRTSSGATALMLAAASGNAPVIQTLLEHGADANATESANGQTALMFGAAANRQDAVRALLAHGARTDIVSKVVDLTGLVAPEDKMQQEIRDAQNAKSASQAAANAAPGAPAMPRPRGTPAAGTTAGVTRAFTYNELIGKQGGLTALHFAARQGAVETVKTLADGGADINQLSPADHTSPLLIATINGHFDTAALLLGLGADPNLSSDAGMSPLYAVLNVEWAPKAFYPQPRAYLQQHASYLDLTRALLDKGADPNQRLNKKIWYTQFNFDLLRIDESGATPFWRAAYASDIAAMQLLVAHGADLADQQAGRPDADRRQRSRGARDVAAAAGAGRRSRHPAAARRGRAGLRRRVRGQCASLRARRDARRGQVPRRGTARRRQCHGRRREHRRPQRGVARRQRDDPVPGLEGRRREDRQPPRPDHGRHGERPGAAHAALSRDHQAARGAWRQEQPQVRVLLNW